MVEIFKTNVKNSAQANMLMAQIHKNFAGYKVNFDLEDCDNILRVQCTTEAIQAPRLINLLKELGFHAQVLPDFQEGSSSVGALVY